MHSGAIASLGEVAAFRARPLVDAGLRLLPRDDLFGVTTVSLTLRPASPAEPSRPAPVP